MKSVKIIVDSGGDLGVELCQRLNVVSIPLTMTVDGVDFVDTMDMDAAKFLAAVEASPNVTRSACPSPMAYAQEYEGVDEVYVITLSSKLSGSYQSAMSAKELSGNGHNVYVFDSLSASAGPALQAVKLRSLLSEGLPREVLIPRMEAFIKKMQTLFVLEDLNPMIKNGRMNRLTGKLVMALQIRPILAADEGEVIQLDKARGTKAAHRRLADIAVERCPNSEGKVAFISHCFNKEGALALKAMLEERCRFSQIIVEPTRGLSTLYASRHGVVLCF